ALRSLLECVLCFFFQAEDGIRDRNVTGVQTCALPISCDSISKLDRSSNKVSLSEPIKSGTDSFGSSGQSYFLFNPSARLCTPNTGKPSSIILPTIGPATTPPNSIVFLGLSIATSTTISGSSAGANPIKETM